MPWISLHETTRVGNLGKNKWEKNSHLNRSKPYVKQCPLIVQAACVLAGERGYWQNSQEACFRSLCSCCVVEACSSGCPLSPAHATFTTGASDQLEAWASISLYGSLSAYLDLQLYIGGLTSKGTVIFFSSFFLLFLSTVTPDSVPPFYLVWVEVLIFSNHIWKTGAESTRYFPVRERKIFWSFLCS